MAVVLLLLFVKRNLPLHNVYTDIKKHVFFLPFLLFVLLQLVLFAAHLHHFKQAIKGLTLFGFEYVALFVMLAFTLKSRRELRLAVSAFAAVFLLVGVYGLLTKIAGTNPFIDFFVEKARAIGNDQLVFTYIPETRFGIEGRIQSVVFHPIAYGGILALFIPAFSVEWVRTSIMRTKLLWYALVVVLSVNLLLANSRAAVAALSVGLLSTVLGVALLYKSTSNKVLLGIPVVLLLGGILIGITEFKDFIGEAFRGIDAPEALKGSTFPDRSAKFQFTWQVLEGNRAFGLGFGAVADFIRQKNDGLGGAESFWIKQLLEAGIAGVFSYFLFFAGSIFQTVKAYKRTPSLENLYLLFMLLGYFVFISLTGELDTFPYFVMQLAIYSNLSATQIQAND